MVRAILDGRKTQTRRVVKLPHNNPLGEWEPTMIGGENGGRTKEGQTIPLQGAIWHTRTGECLLSSHGQPGDRLWVRETWVSDDSKTAFYRADCETSHAGLPWRPSIHMPRWASRITLEVTGVHADRLQNMSYGDAQAEGWNSFVGHSRKSNTLDPLCWYRLLWDGLNAARGYGWDVNPWVWVVEFRRIVR
ncbi:hypothetical protein [Mycetohabitans rhizoxinica]|uniref:Phage-related protein n=1 Tax=Mycetohabitans rhizoxinica TaxID=412963 RepID=A0ABZ2PXC0_9BURK